MLPIHVGTHDLQSLNVHNVTSQTICFDFRFVIGKLTSAVDLVIMESDSTTVSYHRKFSNESRFDTQCYNVLGIAFIQKVLAYDGLGDSPAFVLEDITVPTGLSIPSTFIHSTNMIVVTHTTVHVCTPLDSTTTSIYSTTMTVCTATTGEAVYLVATITNIILFIDRSTLPSSSVAMVQYTQQSSLIATATMGG